jgi:hypothetical protein
MSNSPENGESSGGEKPPSVFEVLKKIGFMPYALASLGIATATYLGKYPGTDTDPVKQFLKLLSASLFLAGILWALTRLFQKTFTNRPARGLIDGLFAGMVAGFVGGQLGYGWGAMSRETYAEPGYLRVLFALVFTVPVSGILGLGCDLIHTDRKIHWRRDLGLVLLVGVVVLGLVGFGVFKYVPNVQAKGITFSNLLLLFEAFVITFCALMSWQLTWPWKRFAGRLGVVLFLIAALRITTWFLHTTAPGQADTPLWEREFFHADGPLDPSGAQGEYEMAVTVIAFCIWTLFLYAIFHSNHPLNKCIDRLMTKAR